MFKKVILLGLIFILIDSIYLSLMKNNFQKLIKNIQGSDLKLNIPSTILCYIFLISSIYYFIISKNGTILDAFLLGIFIYGVYETTNTATFKKWNYKIALIDTLWGGILFASTIYVLNQILK